MQQLDLESYSQITGIPFARRASCADGLSALSRNQLAVHALASMHAMPLEDDRRPTDMVGKRGALVFHATGSGKTCCVVCIVDAFWDADTEWPGGVVVVTSPAALKSNPEANYQRCCAMLPRFAGMTASEIARRFARRKVQFTTFAKLAHQTGVYRPSLKARGYTRKPTVFIVDEAHLLFRPLPTQRNEMRAVLDVLFGDQSEPTDKFFLLTATPGETRTDVLKLLNILRDPTVLPRLTPPATPQECRAFVADVSYMVSRYDPSFDSDIFPTVSVQDVRLPMKGRQYARYREAVVKTAQEDRDYDALKRAQRLEKLYASARRFSNVLFQVDPADPLASASVKLPELLRRVSTAPLQKHYVYSSFGDRRGSLGGQGVHAVAWALSNHAGFSPMTQTEVDALSELLADDDDSLPILKAPRFVVVTPTTLASGSGSQDDALARVLRVFNSPHNLLGEYVQVMLASGQFFESMDLRAVRHVHIFDPMLSASAQQQAVGRAARRCSHAQLPPEQRSVTVHRYFAIAPSERDIREQIREAKEKLDVAPRNAAFVGGLEQLLEFVHRKTVDEFIDEIARQKHAPVARLLRLLEVGAYDCSVFRGDCDAPVL